MGKKSKQTADHCETAEFSMNFIKYHSSADRYDEIMIARQCITLTPRRCKKFNKYVNKI